MKEFKIEVPEGMEIDRENSTFECIRFKEKQLRFPDSVREIQGRHWYVHSFGFIQQSHSDELNNLSTKSRAEAFLALMQLVELRDHVNDGWVPDWSCNQDLPKSVIEVDGNKITIQKWYHTSRPLYFKSEETAEKFLEKYRSLIETAKELL